MTRSEWLAARKKGIGASEASSIVGVNPWKKSTELWEEKTGRREPENLDGKPVVEFGKNAEGAIRKLFALDYPEYKLTYDEFGMVANRPNEPWLFATLDGELEHILLSASILEHQRKGVLEIKTTEIMRPAQWALWNEQIPPYYYTQLLHQLLATGYYFAILKVRIKSIDFRAPNDPAKLKSFIRHYYITIDDDGVREDMNHLLQEETAFWEHVKNDIRPPLILPSI